jgi:hypothetical protein
MKSSKNYNLLVGIVTKNNVSTLPYVLKNIETYTSLFKDYKTVIVDGWSNDGTDVLCKEWCKNDLERRSFILQKNSNLKRMESLVEARNTIIDFFLEYFNEDTLILLLDSDSPNVPPIDITGFLTCFDRDDWIALFANQPTKYYDLYALRDSLLDMDYQIKYKGLKWNGEMQNALQKYTKPKTSCDGFWPVKSAFGGAGLYKTHIIKKTNARYSANIHVNNILVPVCEHVPFNETLLKYGGKMYVNCNWINGDHE